MTRTQFDRAFDQLADGSQRFSNQSWLAVAFDRDRYDVMRLPRAFFEALRYAFAHDTQNSLWVGAASASESESLIEVPFTWDDVRSALLSKRDFSIEFKAVLSDHSLAISADPDITLVGGSPERFDVALSVLGGRTGALDWMRNEFSLVNRASASALEFDAYLRSLLKV